jgi:serine/threonine protein kinase
VESTDVPTQSNFDTGVGALLGTRLYMSPEQLRGQPLSAKWDLWAMAIITYEILTGVHPFDGSNSVAALHHAILAGQFRPLDPGTSAGWQDFFARSLNAMAMQRPASAAEFLALCEQTLQDPAI